MSHRVLVSAPYMQPALCRFSDVFARHDIEAVVPQVKERLSEEELLLLVGDVDGIICGDDRITDRVLAAPRYRQMGHGS